MSSTSPAPLTPDELASSLADATRARITLLVTSEGELCVCELTSALQVSQPKISRHLAVLRASGLLADERRGQWVYYRLHPEVPAWVRQVLSTMLEANKDWLEENLEHLAAMSDRPQRCC
jgi:ArsR family transcriptional regulator